MSFAAVAAETSWGEIAAVLERCGVSQVPVVREGEILGWVGDRELRRAVLSADRAEGSAGVQPGGGFE